MNAPTTDRPEPGRSHRIEVRDGDGSRTLALEGVVEVGREAGDVIVADPAVSSRHLRLDATGPALVATDLGSTNGTFRAGVRLAGPTVLAAGDRLDLGAATIEVLAPPATVVRPGSAEPRTAPLATPAPAPAPAPAPPVGVVAPPEPQPPTPTPTPAPSPASPGAVVVRTEAVEVRAAPGSLAERRARSYATAAARARRRLTGFGSEPWGTVPVLHLLDPYEEAGVIVASGAVVDATRGEAWIVVGPEGPEPPHRALALIFGAAFPAFGELGVLVEGFGLHVSGAPEPDLVGPVGSPLSCRPDDPQRADLALSFVRALIEREGEDGVRRLLGAAPGRVDETAREVYGPSLPQLEQQWRQKVALGDAEVKTGEFLRLSLRYLRPYKVRQAEIFVFMLFSLAFVAAFPFVTRRLFDQALPSGEFSQVLGLLVALGVCFVVSLVAGVRQAYQTAWVSGAVTRDLRQSIFDRVQVLPTSWFRDHPQGDVMSRLFSDVEMVRGGLSQAIGQGVFQLLSLVVSAVIMLSINFWMGLVVLVAAPLVGIVYRAMAAGAQSRSLVVQEQASALMTVAAENYQANPVVKLFGLAERERRRFGLQGDRVFRATTRLTMWGGFFGLSVNLIVTLLRLCVLGFGAWLILEGRFTIGGLVAFLAIMGEVLAPVTVLVTLSQDVQAAMGSLIRINELVDAAGEQDDGDLPPVPPLVRELRLASVALSYGDGHRVLDGLDLRLAAGTRVAIVGPSGSGKSSVLRLLMRLSDPEEGAVLVDGVDIRDCSLRSWRDQLGVVFQDSFLFDATIRENIALGRPGATDEQVRAAAAAAEVDDVVDSLPRGWDTLVGEGGANLSGGQRQRVAIARALIREPRLLLLDEATSALDPGTERQINETLRRVAAGRTTVAVTHRLASVVDADLIVVVVDGRVAEQGRHQELMDAGGAYAGLWAEQTGGRPRAEPVAPPRDATRLSRLTGARPARAAG